MTQIKAEIIGAVLALTCVIFISFWPVILNYSKVLPAAGDGVKNYFTYLYHIQHDQTYWKFEGMHYPYGENIVFTDNQPLLATLVKYVNSIYPMSNEGLIGIHNLVLFLGLILGGLGIFLVLRRLGTGYIFALACTLGLMLLQPQINRFNSHYSMVYPVLPWIFYFWLCIWNSNHIWKYSFFIGLFATAFGLIHMYHFLTIAVLCFLAAGLSFVEAPGFTNLRKNIGLLLLQVALPFTILYVVSNKIYPVPDRPEKVWGFFAYHSSWEGLFFSYELPLFRFINENITKVRTIDIVEGVNYIGLISVFFILAVIILSLVHLKKLPSRLKNSFSIQGKLAWIFVLSALISFGYPFTIKGLDWLLDYSGPFQQFRSIGRIGWISFYAINFLSIPYIYKRSLTFQQKWVRMVVWVTIPVILFLEGYYSKPDMSNPPHLVNAFQTRKEPFPFDITQYQALLPDPYLHSGSECFSWPPIGYNQDQAFEVGMQLGLPGMETVLSRTSLTQAALLNQLVCLPYDVPDIITYLKTKDQRPILVLESTLDLYTKSSSLSHWTKRAEIIYETEGYRLRKLPLFHFDTIVKQFQDSIQKIKVDTIFSRKLDFQPSLKEKDWGFEALLYCDSITRGDATIAFEIVFTENTDVNSITEVWQITKDHQTIDQFSMRNNYHYKQISGNRLFIEIPINIKAETDKIAIRLSKDRQRKNEKMPFENARLFKTFSQKR